MGDRVAALRCMQQAEQSRADTANPQSPQLVYQLVQSAVISDPTYAEGWVNVGDANMVHNRLNGAVAAYRRALDLDELDGMRRAKTKVSMGESLRRLGHVEEAARLNQEAIDYDSRLAYAWLNLSQCYSTMGLLAESLTTAQRGYDLDPSDCKLQMGLAFANLFNGDYATGLKHFEARFDYRLKSFLSYPYPKWEGEADKQVFLVADQGIGDTLTFARFVKRTCARSKFVHMAVQPELLRLFSASFQSITNLNILPLPCPWPSADAWTTFMSLPWALGLTTQQIIEEPNIAVPPFYAPSSQWKSPDRKLHIGVSWAGSAANDIDVWRSFPMEHLLTLYEVPGIQLYSLQVGDRAADVHNLGCATLIRDLAPFIRDISDTIAILSHLDMVICCESALGHICSLVGKEAWIPYSYHGREFRIGHDGTSRLWCPQHRIFKQGPDARWEPVFRSIAAAMNERLAMKEAAE